MQATAHPGPPHGEGPLIRFSCGLPGYMALQPLRLPIAPLAMNPKTPHNVEYLLLYNNDAAPSELAVDAAVAIAPLAPLETWICYTVLNRLVRD